MPRRQMLARLILTALVLMLSGNGVAQLRIVTSIVPYGDLAGRLGGDLVEVSVMLPPGASPHTFEPSPRDAASLAGADVVLLNGGTDEWLHEMAEEVNPEARVVEALAVLEDALATVDEDAGEHSSEERAGHASDEHAHYDVNPHVWLDPILMREVVTALAESLADLDPENAEVYLERGRELSSELARLDAELRETLAAVSEAPFIPFHDAWPYFTERYGLDLIVEIEPFPGREPSPRYLAFVVETIRTSGAPAIFNEAGLSDRPARVLAAEADVALFTLDPLGRAGESYGALLRRNAATILEALSPWEPR